MAALVAAGTPVAEEELAQLRTVCLGLGTLFQAQDDVLDAFAPPEVIGKVGTDIEESKCSWLVVRALKQCSPEQRAVLSEHYGRTPPAGVAAVKEVYGQLGLREQFLAYEEGKGAEVRADIARLASPGLRRVCTALLAKITKRKL